MSTEAAGRAALRYAAGTATALTVAEAFSWTPTFLAAVFAGLLLVQVPAAPLPAVAVALLLHNVVAAAVALTLTAFLFDFPLVLIGALAMIVYRCFHRLALGEPPLGPILMLLYAVVLPVSALESIGKAPGVAFSMVGSFAVALATVWLVHLVLPAPRTPDAARSAPARDPTPERTALVHAAILVPMMTVFLVLGLAHALPALVSTMLILSQLGAQASRGQAVALVRGNLIGGVIALVALLALAVAPSLSALWLLVFLAGHWLATRLFRGGPGAGEWFVAGNAMLILLGASLAQGQETSLVWVSRVLYMLAAALVAVGTPALLRGVMLSTPCIASPASARSAEPPSTT